jgi:gag-polyprotein putative aspartyl protease
VAPDPYGQPKSKTGALLFAHEDPDRVDEELLRQPKDQDKERPLYVTWSVSEDGDLPAFAISPFPADLVTPVPVPGEARVVRALRRLVLIQDIKLGFGSREARRDAIFDTSSTHCMITKALANRLNLHPGERIGAERVQGVSGRAILLDRYLLEYVRAGTAQAWDVDILVGGTAPGNFMLLGMSFIEKFQTTLHLDEMRVVFRLRSKEYIAYRLDPKLFYGRLFFQVALKDVVCSAMGEVF